MSGESVYNNFRKLIKVEDQKLIPFIVKDLLRHPAQVIKTINAGGGAAQNVMDKLVARAKETYNNWKSGNTPEDEI